jgi:Fe2+ transport system protein FeoA
MEQIKTVEQTRLPPPFTHPDADAARSKKLKSRLFKIGMTGDISSKILHARNEGMIIRRQTGNDLSINTVDAARLLELKNTAVV